MAAIPSTDILAAARAFVRHEGEAVSATSEQLDESFESVVRLVLETQGKVFVTGSGTSGFIARRMAHLLSVCGTPAVYLPPMDALHGTMAAASPGDSVIALSKGGMSSEIVDLVHRLRDRGVRSVAVTARPQSDLAKAADITVTITTPDTVDPGGLIAMGSTLTVAAWGDSLAYTLMRLRGYSWDDVLQTHPAGAVGLTTTLPDALDPLALDD